MAFDTNWDTDKYKAPFESEDHWFLKKQFIEAHKDKYPEDRLICLAQCFFNIEFMGARYPDKVMKLIETLSQDVAAEHREKQKTKLQRTFVKASDAAGARIKGSKRSGELDESNSKKQKTDDQPLYASSERLAKLPRVPSTNSPFSHVVLFNYNAENSNAKGVIKTSLEKLKMNVVAAFEVRNDKWVCTLNVDDEKLASGESNVSKKEAERIAFDNAYEKLLNDCYLIEVNTKPVQTVIKDDAKIEKSEVLSSASDKNKEKLDSSNIGMKLLKMMGWAGGGLGKNEQGIEEPVQVSSTVTRSGLGCTSGKNLIEKLRQILNKFREDGKSTIAFSSDFTKDERAFIHSTASRQGFSTKSFGKNNERFITVSKKTNVKSPWEIVKILYYSEDRISTLGTPRNTFKLRVPTSLGQS